MTHFLWLIFYDINVGHKLLRKWISLNSFETKFHKILWNFIFLLQTLPLKIYLPFMRVIFKTGSLLKLIKRRFPCFGASVSSISSRSSLKFEAKRFSFLIKVFDQIYISYRDLTYQFEFLRFWLYQKWSQILVDGQPWLVTLGHKNADDPILWDFWSISPTTRDTVE